MNKSWPSNFTDPDVGTSRPAISPNKVLFPDPELPVMATASVCPTVKLTMLKMSSTPELSVTRWQRSFTSILGVECMRWTKSLAVISGMILMVGLRLSAAATSDPAPQPGESNMQAELRILVVGDSLSAEYGLARGSGWVQHIAQRLAKRNQAYQIRNASISGDTTITGAKRLPSALADFKPTIVVVQLGANDGLRGLPLPEMKANLQKMIELSKDAGAKVLLVGQHIPPNYGRRYADSFHAVYAELAQETGIALVPFMLEDIALDPEMFQADGLHPTAEAQRAIADTIWHHLEPLLGQTAVQ